ncbi:MAG: DNA polymerase Y family protein [Stappiaceae bacterium]
MHKVASTTPRFLSLWLPRLPTDRIARQRWGRSWLCGRPAEGKNSQTLPFAVTDRIKNAQRLTAIDRLAQTQGIKRDETVSDARSRVPNLEIFPADKEADQALLAGLADWCDRYTPLVALDGEDGLMLDISGCAHLFGGETSLIDDLIIRLKGQGFTAKAAIADTAAAAWAFARYSNGGVVVSGEHRIGLETLPLAALRLELALVGELSRTGLKQIRDLIGRPRAPLVNRFGSDLMRRLDLALGNEKTSICPRLPVPACMAERRFAEPIVYEEDIRRTILSLATRLSERLEERNEGIRAVELILFRVDGALSRLMVGTSRPVRTPVRILDLFTEKLQTLGDELDAGFGFDLIRLGAIEVQRLDPAQIDMAGETLAQDDLACLIDRLGARLGMAQVARFLPQDTHLPERRTAEVPAALVKEDAFLWSGETRPGAEAPIERPIRLFERPEPVETIAAVPEGPPLRFRWRKALHEITRVEGPERIAAEWWRQEPDTPTRDYYRVEDDTGLRFWLYREGLYGREVENPRWYMHGIFP